MALAPSGLDRPPSSFPSHPPAASFARRKKTTFLAILRRISPYLPRLGIFIVIFFLFLLLSLNRCEIELGSERVASHHFVLPKL